MKFKFAIGAGALALLTSCGGGHDVTSSSPTPLAAKRAPLASAAPPTAPEALLFDWAEAALPQLFSGPSSTGTYDVYTYRIWPQTGNIVGVADGRVYVLGPATGGVLYSAGRLLDFACLTQPDSCTADQPLSAVQSRFEAETLAPASRSFLTMTSRTAFSSFQAYSDLEFFLSVRQLSGSPRNAPDSTTSNIGAVPLVSTASGAGVPERFATCSEVVPSPNAVAFLNVVLDDRGHLVKTCSSGPTRPQYIGENLYQHSLDENGRTYLTNQLLDLTPIPIPAGQNIQSWLAQHYSDVAPLQHVQPNPATFPAGSAMLQQTVRRVTGYFIAMSADLHIHLPADVVPVQLSGQAIGTAPATTLEQIFPWRIGEGNAPLAIGSGNIQYLSGRRAWVASPAAPGPSGRRAFVEVDGKVYAGSYYLPATEPTVSTTSFNAAATDAITAAHLKWVSDTAKAN